MNPNAENSVRLARSNAKTNFLRQFQAAAILFLCCINVVSASQDNQAPIVGAEQFDQYIPLLAGKRVALVVNQSSVAKDAHLVDQLLSKNINVTMIFAPEHGFRGNIDAGASVANGTDKRTGLPIFSLYGENKQPPAELMQQLDLVVFDIQDVGTRFYTYISTLHYVMQAAADNKVGVVVLDRPNPNGAYVQGPTRKTGFESFVGVHPIPLLHGMSVGELAQMIKGEAWIQHAEKLALNVIPVKHWQRNQPYDLPIAPSPNLPNAKSIQLYPSLCMFEPTSVSIGRGTSFPFQAIGSATLKLGEFNFTPKPIIGAASNPKHNGKNLNGLDLRDSDIKGFDISLLHKVFNQYKQHQQVFFTAPEFFDKLAGSDTLRKQLEAGLTPKQIEDSWKHDLEQFKKTRSPYLIYPSNE